MGESCPEGNLSSRASQPLKSSRGHFFCFSFFFLRFALLSERGLPHKLTSTRTTTWQKRTYCANSCVSGKVLSPHFKE